MARMTHVVAVAKLESGGYGTDAVPAAATAADMVLCRNVTIKGMEAQQAARNRVLPWHGHRGRPGLHSRSVQLTAEVPFCSAGAAGTVPAWGKLLRMCGMAEVITAGTNVSYTPVSAGQESGSWYYFMDGSRHRALGARGSFSVSLVAGEEPSISVDMTGLYSDPTAVALPTGNYTAWRDAVVPRANITTCQIGGFSLAMKSARYNHGNSVVVRDLPQVNEVRLVDRAPTLNVVVQAPDGLNPANFHQLIANESETSVVIVHGPAAGDIVELRCLQARLLPGITYEADGDVAMLGLSFMPRPSSSGNDEVQIVAR